MNNDLSQQQRIILKMLLKEKDWYLPMDFMKNPADSLFVGYEASARLSELAKEYPDMIGSQKQGKYMARRIRYENIDTFLPALPKDLRYCFHRRSVTPSSVLAEGITAKLL